MDKLGDAAEAFLACVRTVHDPPDRNAAIERIRSRLAIALAPPTLQRQPAGPRAVAQSARSTKPDD